MKTPIRNLRIHVFGAQGSGSTFPTAQEFAAYHQQTDYAILSGVFQDLAARTDDAGRIDCTLEDILGGPFDREAILRYRQGLDIPQPRVYGGLTTCIWVETADGHDIVIDCGSGFRHCARELQAKWGEKEERNLHIFGSHSHYDHTEGFDQAAVCFDPRNQVRLHGNSQFLHALDMYLGIFSKRITRALKRVKTPLTFREMPATFLGTELRDYGSDTDHPTDEEAREFPWEVHDVRVGLRIGATTVSAFPVYHTAPCLAFKFEHGDKSFVFCTDHELRHGDPEDERQRESEQAEARLIEECRGIDILYRDGQFLRSEYDGVTGIGRSKAVPRMDWGHSCIEDIREMAAHCGIAETYIGHHDPNRGWSERNEIDNSLERFSAEKGLKIELARAGMLIDI